MASGQTVSKAMLATWNMLTIAGNPKTRLKITDS